MVHTVVIREARAQDKTAILPFCHNTFSWGDYICEVWEAWLADELGRIFVGIVDDQPVGMVHVALLNDSVAWMEGMRVHPDHRRQGVSSAMDAAGRAYARERGRKLARLATSQDNVAAQRVLEHNSYVCIARFGEWRAKATRGKMARIATEDDLPLISACWSEVPCAIVANHEWRWEKLDESALADLQPQSLLRTADGGFAILRKPIDENALILHALSGSENAMSILAHSARSEAKYRGYPLVEAMILDDLKINRALKHAGFHCDGGMLIYEQAL